MLQGRVFICEWYITQTSLQLIVGMNEMAYQSIPLQFVWGH